MSRTAFLLGGLVLVAVPGRAADPPKRLPPRPTPPPEELTARAADLRAVYSKPPADWPEPTVDPGVEFVELGLLPAVPHPADNPPSAAKADLGKVLFFDPRLSGSRQIACASCHDPDLGWADGRTTSFGHGRRPLKRNAPTIRNAGYAAALFWDGRAAGLEAQAHAVLLNRDEMRGSRDDILTFLSGSPGYRRLFAAAFPTADITWDRVAQAIAAFERTVTGGRSRFDAFLRGKADALTDAEVRGLHLFRTAARCANCHHGPALTDDRFHDTGLSYYGRQLEDLGRYRVTNDPADAGKFKTPGLRDVGRTAPYMHHGLFDLDAVLILYNAGMPTLRRPGVPGLTPGARPAPPFPVKSPLLKPLRLGKADLADLKAFLLALDEPRKVVRPPDLPPAARPAD